MAGVSPASSLRVKNSAFPPATACSFSPNRNRLLPISISLKVSKSGKPDFGGGEGWDEGGVPRVSALRPAPLTPTLSPLWGRGSFPLRGLNYFTRSSSVCGSFPPPRGDKSRERAIASPRRAGGTPAVRDQPRLTGTATNLMPSVDLRRISTVCLPAFWAASMTLRRSFAAATFLSAA